LSEKLFRAAENIPERQMLSVIWNMSKTSLVLEM
jgi:hypothetical protein